MSDEKIHVGQYFKKLVENSKEYFVSRYDKSQLEGIEDFINVISEECINQNLHLVQTTFIELFPKEKLEEIEPAETTMSGVYSNE